MGKAQVALGSLGLAALVPLAAFWDDGARWLRGAGPHIDNVRVPSGPLDDLPPSGPLDDLPPSGPLDDLPPSGPLDDLPPSGPLDDIVVPPAGALVTEQEVNAAVQQAQESASPSVARNIVKAACLANTMHDLNEAETLSEAVEVAVREFGGNYTFHLRVENLSEELRKAETAGTAAAKTAAAATCEAYG